MCKGESCDFLSEFDYKLIWKAGEDNVVPDALSRIFGEIARQIEESEGVQIMNDQENAASASVLAQEASDSIAEVSASEELALTENDRHRGGCQSVHEMEQEDS